MEVIYITISALFGLSFGSFLNSFEWRLKQGRSVLKERSMCPSCGMPVRWYDNIPVISFVILGGRCRDCQVKFSWQYLAVELWMGLVFVFIFWFEFNAVQYFSPVIFLQWFIVWVLTFIFIYDLKYMEVVDSVTLGAAGIIFILGGFVFWNNFTSMLIGVAIGAGFFLLQFVISKGKWVGGGDIRIGLLMGVILGWELLLVALWIAYVIGAIVGVGLLITKKKGMKSEVAFGTFLTVATFFTMFWGEPIIDWYLRLIY